MWKQASTIFTESLIRSVRERCDDDVEAKAQAVRQAERFQAMTDEELWSMMFGPTLKRAYHVFSNGYCPSCRGGVAMYNWRLDVVRHPWKVQCPLCGDTFPRNDFYRYYRSGLDRSGAFSYELADTSLLYNERFDANAKSGDGGDAGFGVDDGNGFAMDGNKWYFVAYYLLFGQWALNVLEGIRSLSRAYVITGDKEYARKACIMLDRVADLFPEFDFMKQGIIYEKEHNDVGYISYYFRSCTDIRDLTLAYDMIFDAVKDDERLVEFLGRKAEETEGVAAKRSFADIQRNIEGRLFLDAAAHRGKFEANFPMTDTTICLIHTILGWSDNRAEVESVIDGLAERVTAVDGTTGEKGLVVYSAYALFDFGMFLSLYDLMEPGFLGAMLRKCPALADGYRFFIDTWCLGKYYPRIGNTGAFAKPDYEYAVFCYRDEFFTTCLDPDIDVFMWRLFEITGDANFARAVRLSRRDGMDGVFRKSLLTQHPDRLCRELAELMAAEGDDLAQTSVLKEQWKLALLHSGRGKRKRAFWMKFDSGGQHGHNDGLAVGLFALGLDLLPDFGYAPVQYGLFGNGPERPWYYSTAAHNTVVVDGRNHGRYEGLRPSNGESTLWKPGGPLQAVRASAPELTGGRAFERMILAIDIDERDSYYVDWFHVAGGGEHVKYMHGPLGDLSFEGLEFAASEGFAGQAGAMMKQFALARPGGAGWSAVWRADDRHFRANDPERPAFLKYIDLTGGDSEVYSALSWIDLWPNAADKSATQKTGAWIPSVMIRRTGAPELESVFVGLFEPYEDRSNIVDAKRRAAAAGQLIIEAALANDVTDYIVIGAAAAVGPDPVTSHDPEISSDAEVAFLRTERGVVTFAAMVAGSRLRVGALHASFGEKAAYVELDEWVGRRIEPNG